MDFHETDFLEIGKIVNTQGSRGDVRIVVMSDDPGVFDRLAAIMIRLPGGDRELTVERVWRHKKFVIIKFVGVDDMNAGEALRGGMLVIPRALAKPLEDDEYFIGDLYGMDVVTEEGEHLGRLADILFTGANDVYIVRGGDKRELLLPAIKPCILHVDVEGRRMTVRLMEGLRD